MVRNGWAAGGAILAAAVLALLAPPSSSSAADLSPLDGQLQPIGIDEDFAERLTAMRWTGDGVLADPMTRGESSGEFTHDPPVDRDVVVIPLPSALYVFPLGALVAGWCARRFRR